MICSDMCEVNSGESCSLDFAICKLYGLKQVTQTLCKPSFLKQKAGRPGL